MYIKKLKPFDLPKEAQRISINVSINTSSSQLTEDNSLSI
jgi:hypothetical protein